MTHKFIGAALPVAILLNPFMTGLGAAERPSTDSIQPDHRAAPFAQEYESHVTVRADHTAAEVIT